jgi:hypothetical protein
MNDLHCVVSNWLWEARCRAQIDIEEPKVEFDPFWAASKAGSGSGRVHGLTLQVF